MLDRVVSLYLRHLLRCSISEAFSAIAKVFRHVKGNQSDFDALRAAKIEAGIEDDSEDGTAFLR